jgi:hypothetical protein
VRAYRNLNWVVAGSTSGETDNGVLDRFERGTDMDSLGITVLTGSLNTFALMLTLGGLAFLLDRAVLAMEKFGVDQSLCKMMKWTCLAIAAIDCLLVLGIAVTHLVHCFNPT